MTHKRTWLAFGALMLAIVAGTVWAAEQEKKPAAQENPTLRGLVTPTQVVETAVSAGTVKCEAKDKPCCEGKCCTAEKAKSCCADGKCCGCCEKGKSSVTLPILPGSTFELLIRSPGAVDGNYPAVWGGECMEQPRYCPAVPPTCPAPMMPQTCPQPVMPPAPQAPSPSVQFTPVTQYVPTQSYTPVTQYVATPPVQPPLPPPCAYPTCRPNVGSPWQLRAVAQKDHTRLEMQFSAAGEDTCAYCDDMVLKIGNEKLKVNVVEKQLHVHGSFVTGSADCLMRNPADGSVTFEGHVKLTYEKNGQKAEVSAERVVIGMADGRLEVKPTEQQQVFSFWTGFFQ
jgi:hypothetical protein